MPLKIKTLLFTLLFFTVNAQTTFELQKLEDFAKVYGVVRYFHPSDEASKINWNQFAAYGVEELSKVKDQNEYDRKLRNLFLPLAPSVSFNNNLYTWNTNNLYPVFWIHNGLGIDNTKVRKDYISKRFNRSKTSKTEHSYVFINVIPKEIKSDIKITYEAKSADGGESFVYVNVYNSGKEKANFKTHQYEPVVSKEWKQKELIISNDLPVKRINLGLMSTKADSEFKNVKLWFLNIKKEWISYTLPSFTDEEWRVNNLFTLIDRSDSGLKFKDSSSNGTSSYNVTWDKYIKLDLSNNLTVTIPTVVYSNQTSTLPVADKNLLSGIQSSLEQQSFNRNVALANVIISWNIFKHFYPYQDVVKVNWDYILEEALKDAYDDQNEYDNYLSLARFQSKFNDGHMSVYYPGLLEKRRYASGIAVRYINNELVIKDVLPDIKDIQKGDIVTMINGTPTKKYLDSLQQYLSGSKQFKEWGSAIASLRGIQNSSLKLSLKNGKEVTLTRKIEYNSNIDFYTRDNVTKTKEINQNTYYVNMDKLSSEEMEAEIPTIRKYKNLIIDLRGYPRTDQQHRLLNYLLPIEDSAKWLCRREIYLPDFKYYNETCNGDRLRKFISDNPLKTNNVLLIDERSVSNAEMFAQVVKHYKLATIIGNSSAGANGNRNDINLLNGFQIGFTGLKVVNPDGSTFHTIGVTPDIIVTETPEDLKNSRDVYIEKALVFFEKK